MVIAFMDFSEISIRLFELALYITRRIFVMYLRSQADEPRTVKEKELEIFAPSWKVSEVRTRWKCRNSYEPDDINAAAS